MTVETRYQERYEAGDTPWDIGQPDGNLIQTVTTTPVAPGKAVDLGCGTGDNALWLAQHHFQVVGIDASERAIAQATAKAVHAQVRCTFLVGDILTSPVEGAPFRFAFDRGCFHSFETAADRTRLAEKVQGLLGPAGLWLSLIGNADEPRQAPGPPQRTACEIVTAVESSFEILSLVASHFGSNRPHPPRAWACLMRKRRAE